MRVLSQNGKFDFPYEQVCLNISLNINKNSETSFRIYAWHSLSVSNDSCYLMAEYSTEAKARKAMEMLHEKYSTLRMQEVIDRNVNQVVYDQMERANKIKFFTALFQFPADNEVEG